MKKKSTLVVQFVFLYTVCLLPSCNSPDLKNKPFTKLAELVDKTPRDNIRFVALAELSPTGTPGNELWRH